MQKGPERRGRWLEVTQQSRTRPLNLNPILLASRPLSYQGARICREQKVATEGSFLGPLTPGCEQGPDTALSRPGATRPAGPETCRGLELGPWGRGRAGRLRPERVTCTQLQVLPPQSGQTAEVLAWLHIVREGGPGGLIPRSGSQRSQCSHLPSPGTWPCCSKGSPWVPTEASKPTRSPVCPGETEAQWVQALATTYPPSRL